MSMQTTHLRLDPVTLRDRLNQIHPPRIVDVRTPAEFETAHIPGSVNVPLGLLSKNPTEIGALLSGNIVLVCRSGARAAQAARILITNGLSNVDVLEGGILAWQKEAPLNKGRQRWDIERQVRLVAGSLVLIFVLGGLVLPGLQYLAAAIGAGLAIAALTNTCAMGNLLSRLPYNRGAHCDLATVKARLCNGSTP